MAKVKIEVLDAVIAGHRKGEQLEVSEESAKYFEKIGYAKIVEAPKAEPKAEPKAKRKQKPKQVESVEETDEAVESSETNEANE